MESPNTPLSPFEDESINIRAELEKYLRYWPWFVISVIIAILIAGAYLRYTPSSYQTQASILIKDEENSSMSQLAAFQDFGLANMSTVNLENEIEILKSRNLTNRVVRQLQLNIRYFSDGRLRNQELFKNNPFKLEVLTAEEDWPDLRSDVWITPISLTEFTIALEESEGETQAFGESFIFEGLEYKITATDRIKKGEATRVSIGSIDRTIDSFRNSLQINPSGKQSSIITINLVSTLPEKSRAVIDELIHQFNRDAIEDRNMVSKNTADFIDERLQIVWSELDSVEMNKVLYKESNKMVDLATEGSLFLENASEFNKKLLESQTELSQIKAMIAYLEAGGQSDLLPANLGIADSGLISLIQQYNQLVMERNKLLVHATESHPSVTSLTEQLIDLKKNVLQSLRNIQSALDIKLEDLGKQERLIGSQLASIPLKERDFTTIERQQEIKQSLYLYLLQKREETSITLAVTEPKAKIVDAAYTPINPVAPKRSIILLAAVLLGGLIPFGVLYVLNLLDNKTRSRNDIMKAIPNASILAEIPKVGDKEADEIVQKNDLGILAESFRVLRTNLQFAGVVGENTTGKTILITSSIKGEGKTMIAVNLATTLAHSGKKVLLIGADVRNPQLPRFFPAYKKAKGLVEYLVYKDSTLQEYLMNSGLSKNLDLLQTGAIPPNPTELLMSPRVNDLLEEAKKHYDYIILDTAPTLLVTDTMLFSTLADASLYVIRAGYTEKKILEFAKGLKQEKKIQNVNFVLNDVSAANYGYGGKYGYGYGYNAEERSFWKRTKENLFGR